MDVIESLEIWWELNTPKIISQSKPKRTEKNREFRNVECHQGKQHILFENTLRNSTGIANQTMM